MNQPWGAPPPEWRPPPRGQPWGPPGQQWGASTGPSVGWAVTLWVVAACCLGGALLLGLVSAAGFMIDNHMDHNGVTTTATVTDVDGSDIAVEFWTEDDYPVSARFTWWPDQYPAVDEQIEITYDPDDPSYVIQAGSDEDRVLATSFAVAAGLCLTVAAGTSIGAVFVHRARSKAARSGGFYY